MRTMILLAVLAALEAGAVCAAGPPQALSAHEQAARALYREIGGARVQEARDNLLAGVRQRPELAPLENVFRDWFDGLSTRWDREGEMAQHYMAAFSEPELRELLAFYQTPAGRKMREKLPELVQKEAERCDSFLDEHEPELQILIAARRKGLTSKEGSQASPP